MSSYPLGFTNGALIRELPVVQSQPGLVFYVADGDTAGNTPSLQGRSAGSDGAPGTHRQPFKTLDYAIGRCVAGRGDIIFVLPGYVDTLVAADEIDVDVSGITIIGVGSGSDQPLIQFDDAAAEFTIGATNVTVMGLNFAASVTVVTKGINMENGSDDFSLLWSRFTTDASGTAEFEDALFNLTSDRMLVEGCSFIMGAGADADSAIHLDGACNGCEIKNTYVEGDYTQGCIEGIATLSQELILDNLTLKNGVTGGLNTVACISLLTGTTGVMQNCNFYTNVAAAVTAAVVADGMFNGGGNWVSSAAETAPIALEGGALSPIVQTTVNDSVADGTDGLGLFTVTGHIFIHGFRLHAEVAASSATTAGINLDATTTVFDTTYVTATDLVSASTAGDFAVALTVGGGWTIRQVEDTTENAQLWNTAVVCPPGQIEWLETGGTPGALVSSVTIYWSEATGGAAVAVV